MITKTEQIYYTQLYQMWWNMTKYYIQNDSLAPDCLTMKPYIVARGIVVAMVMVMCPPWICIFGYIFIPMANTEKNKQNTISSCWELPNLIYRPQASLKNLWVLLFNNTLFMIYSLHMQLVVFFEDQQNY